MLASPIWPGDQSSVTRLVVERLYGWSSEPNEPNEHSQWSYYGQSGGVLLTGNEDGGKHCAAQLLYALSHTAFSIPRQADAYWVGEAGPGGGRLPAYRNRTSNWDLSDLDHPNPEYRV